MIVALGFLVVFVAQLVTVLELRRLGRRPVHVLVAAGDLDADASVGEGCRRRP